MTTNDLYNEQFRTLVSTLTTQFPDEYYRFGIKTLINQQFLPPGMNSEELFEVTVHVMLTYADQESESVVMQDVTEAWVKEQAQTMIAAVDKDSWIGGMHMPRITSFLKRR